MTKYIQLKVGQVVTHKKHGGKGKVESFEPAYGFVVKWLHNGQETAYSPGTEMLEVVEHPVERAGQTKSRLLDALLGRNLDAKTFDSMVDEILSVDTESNALDKLPTCNTDVKVELRNQITRGTLKDAQATMGEAMGTLEFNRRCLGTSTGQALALISTAILRPYIWHTAATDHYGTMAATEVMFRGARKIIDKLELRGFEFMKDHKIRFVPIVKETTRTRSETIIESYR